MSGASRERGVQNPTVQNRASYIMAKRAYQKLCQEKLNEYWKERLGTVSRNNKWPLLKKLLFRKTTGPATELSPEDFSKFFEQKIFNIRAAMPPRQDTANIITEEAMIAPATLLNNFDLVSTDSITKLIASQPNKQYFLDPVPMQVMKSCIDILAQFLALSVNGSLQLGIMPLAEKHSYIKPLLKSPSLDSNDLNRYRPITNISIMSQQIEKSVSIELHRQFIHAPLADEQSDYRANHSTETAILSFISDVRENMSNGCAMAVISLDLSAAFDTVDHELLVGRLKSRFGIDGRCLEWFSSYLQDRSQYVKTDGGDSTSRRTNHGFPQGSKLGPDIYNSYSSPLPRTATRFGCKVSNFADDTFPYISFNEENANTQINKTTNT